MPQAEESRPGWPTGPESVKEVQKCTSFGPLGGNRRNEVRKCTSFGPLGGERRNEVQKCTSFRLPGYIRKQTGTARYAVTPVWGE